MATTNENFIPQIWSAKILDKLDESLVYGNLVNRNYEGEIEQFEDKVKINTIGEVTIKDYNSDIGMDEPEDLTEDQKTLTIDQGKIFSFQVDDVDKFQSNINLLEEQTKRVGYALANCIDQYIASLYTDIPAENQIGDDTTPIDIDKANAYDYLIDLSVVLSNNNVPRKGRWVVVPYWYEGLLLKNTSFTRDTDKVMREGYIGEVAGMSIYTSNNIPNVSKAKYKVIAGTGDSIYMATQLVELESLIVDNKFADSVRGRCIYGVKNLRPEAMALLTCNNKK